MLKSCGCDAMTGAGGSFLGWGSESKERNGLGRSAQGRCTPVGKPGRNNWFADSEEGKNAVMKCTNYNIVMIVGYMVRQEA